MADFKPISPPVNVYDVGHNPHAVFGWMTGGYGGDFVPVVANPDGSGIGPWHQFYGEDPWTTS